MKPLLRCRQTGQSLIDYMLACAALAVALLVPVRDAASPDQPRTLLGIVLNGFQQAYENFSSALSLPT